MAQALRTTSWARTVFGPVGGTLRGLELARQGLAVSAPSLRRFWAFIGPFLGPLRAGRFASLACTPRVHLVSLALEEDSDSPLTLNVSVALNVRTRHSRMLRSAQSFQNDQPRQEPGLTCTDNKVRSSVPATRSAQSKQTQRQERGGAW